MFSIIYEPMHGIIYKNSKKEKRVMRHSEIHKFCDAMLNRVLEGLKSYNNDVKYGYVQRELTNDEVEYLKLRSTCLTPPVPVPTIEKADEMILQDTLQVSLAEHKSREEQEARENVELVNKHLESEEIEKLVEGSENVIDDSLSPRNDEPQILGTRLEPRSDKESPEVERTNDAEVEVIKVVILVNVNEEEDEITDEVYELKRREKGNIVEESRSRPLPTPIRSLRTHTNLVSSDTEKL
ncbi:hypothetical protein Tco_0382605 [Tanacetum coccineum]